MGAAVKPRIANTTPLRMDSSSPQVAAWFASANCRAPNWRESRAFSPTLVPTETATISN